jgi:hypothetical protein
MNQRVPESGGLPLRAMVMVLLFLAVVFLLLGLRAVFSDDGAASQSSAATSTATSSATTPAPSPAAGPKAPVFVYNVSTVPGVAGSTAQLLRDNGWTADARQETLEPHPEVAGTTVYFTDAPGEKSSAEEVAKLLKAPAPLQRAPELKDLQPGVIVIVTG